MRKLYSIAAFAVLAASVSAQNLNPQVQVTNVYESQAPDVRKQDVEVSVPDSVMHFDYVFDYSVFENPYKGAYEFTPYAIRLTPEKEPAGSGKFYLRAGMGYNPYPVLKAAWTPRTEGALKLTLRQNLEGYWGNCYMPSAGINPLDEIYTGRDLEEKFAIEGRVGTAKRIFTFCADYDGIFTSDYIQSTSYHSAGIKARLKSNKVHTGEFVYDVNFEGRFALDNVSHQFAPQQAVEADFDLSGTMGAMLNLTDRLLVDYDLRYDRMYGVFDGSSVKNFALTPHVVLAYGRFDLDLGLRLDYVSKLALHPHLRVNFALARDVFDLYAGVKGSNKVLTYSTLKHYDHYFNPGYNEDFQSPVNEKYNAFLGFTGHIGAHFNYGLEGGRASFAGAPFESVSLYGKGTLTPGIVYCDYGVWFADMNAAWKSPRFEADAAVSLRKTNLDASGSAVNLPLVSADMRAVYNWRERTFLGVSCDLVTAREFTIIGGERTSLPLMADLCAFLQYKPGSRWGLWLKGGNLLNQFIRRTPLHIEQGINFTAGICLSL